MADAVQVVPARSHGDRARQSETGIECNYVPAHLLNILSVLATDIRACIFVAVPAIYHPGSTSYHRGGIAKPFPIPKTIQKHRVLPKSLDQKLKSTLDTFVCNFPNLPVGVDTLDGEDRLLVSIDLCNQGARF